MHHMHAHFLSLPLSVITVPGPPTTAPPTPMVSVSITPSGTNTAGGTYSLVCSVTVTGPTDTPTITWLDPMNSQVPSEMVSTTGSMSTLTFNPLSTSHAGTYTCRATLTSGEMDTDAMEVTVQGECRSRIDTLRVASLSQCHAITTPVIV